MMKSLFRFSMSLIVVACSQGAGADEPVSLSDFRATKAVSAFTGNFEQGGLHGNAPAIITTEWGRLTYWYPAGNIPSSAFSMPLELIGQTVVTKGSTYIGRGTTVKTYSVEGNEATISEETTTLFRKAVEVAKLTIVSSGEIRFTFSRKMYRRQLSRGGRWVEDKSHHARLNAMEKSNQLARLTQKPMPLDVFFEQVKAIPRQYIRLTKGGIASSLDLREHIENGDYEVIGDDDLKSKSGATVIDLKEYRAKALNCSDLLSDQ